MAQFTQHKQWGRKIFDIGGGGGEPNFFSDIVRVYICVHTPVFLHVSSTTENFEVKICT